MKSISPFLLAASLLLMGAVEVRATVDETPHFARRYGLQCGQCHVSPPKLNEYGEAFVRNNYQLSELEPRATLPFAVWASMRSDLPPAAEGTERRLRSYINRLEIVSGGRVAVPWLTYFLEWRPVSFELRRDGTLRDRSGRFEDLFLTARLDHLEVSVGQFRQIGQVDISRRLAVNEPFFYSAGLAGRESSDARIQALRRFSLSGRAPGVRVGWIEERGGGWEWTSYASVSFPGELSIPLTSEAQVEASNEIELRARGLFLESFLRRGMTSVGAHAFVDPGDRYQLGVVATHRTGDLLWSGALGGASLEGTLRGRWTAEGEYLPSPFLAVGTRAEGGGGGVKPALVGYLNTHFPGTGHTFRLTLEQRVQEGGTVTLVELGAVF